MTYSKLNKIFAGLVFAVAILTYFLTLQPSVPFWDCGEFAAAAMAQQVPHPPGAPLWLMVAKSFEVIMPGDPGNNFNLFAALCSAFAALFTYLIAVNAVERFRPVVAGRPLTDYISTYAAGLIGALAFVWSDSNWFNSVESEVYSAATLLAAIAMWIMMRWDQDAERPGHERWILLLAYVMGLAIGVHLLALLIIPPVAMTIYFKRYRTFNAAAAALTVAATGAGFYVLYNGTLTWIPKLLSESMVGGAIALLALVGLAAWAFKAKIPVLFLAAASFALVVLGYTTYTQILVRSAAHPVMNENEPDTFSELARYLGREQYGSRSAWPRRHDQIRGGWYERALKKYGTNLPVPIGQEDDGTIIWDQIDGGEEIGYMIDYQMGHMYFRYLGWNFIGRTSDMQDAGISWTGSVTPEVKRDFIRPTGADDVFPVTFFAFPFLLGLIGIIVHYKRDWKMAAIFTTAFLLWGVVMALQQNQQEPQPRERDYFYTASFMVFSIWVGFGAFGLAEGFARRRATSGDDDDGAEPVATGVEGLNIGMAAGVLGLCLIVGPLNMAFNGWTLHDRSGNWLPWDYAYNLLQSVDENAILFTNGDNDTFPVWYLQDVAGVRRDVRVVNLELAQTPWYIWQMMHEPTWDAPPVPLTFSPEMIRDDGKGRNKISGGPGEPQTINLPVPADVMTAATSGKVTTASTMQWTYTPKDGRFTPKNQIVRSIIEATAREGWKRPVYFSVTSGDEYAGLYPFCVQQGMAYRVMPVPGGNGRMDIEATKGALLGALEGDEYTVEPKRAFKFRGLADRSVSLLGQDDHRRPINLFYHQIFLTLAEQMIYFENDPAGAVEVLDKMIALVPPDRAGPPVPYGEVYSFYIRIAELYQDAGAAEKAKTWATQALDELARIGSYPRGGYGGQDIPPAMAQAKGLSISGQHDQALNLLDQMLAQQPNDQNAQLERDAVRIWKALAAGDTTAARLSMQQALESYGSPEDMRSQVLMSRFPDLFGTSAFPADDAVAEVTEAAGAGE